MNKSEKYHCEDCNKELDINFVRLQMMINESYYMKTENNKLIKKIRELAVELLQEINEVDNDPTKG